jgi:UDP-GlcNAc3NAcA epimerase
MRKIVTILGARPQFIKASVVSNAIAQTPGLSEVLVHTGQHFDANMSNVFFKELGMCTPDHFLDIHGGGYGAMTGRMLGEVEQAIVKKLSESL